MRVRVNYRRIWERFHKRKIPKGFHVHHADGNPNNNEISNLQLLSPQDHAEAHRKLGHKVSEKFIGKANAWDLQTLEDREKIRAKISKRVKGKNLGKIHTEEARHNMSEAHKGQISWLKGKSMPVETREKLRRAHLGKRRSSESKEKARQTMLSRGRNSRGSHGNAKQIICLNTGQIWDCLKDASEELGINYVTLKQFLNKPRETTRFSRLKSLRYV
jgi:hypothetical protein